MQLFKRQEEFFDIPSQDLTPRQIRDKLAQIAAEVLPTQSIDAFKDLLTLKGSANGGNAVTDDLKYNGKFLYQENSLFADPSSVKFSRQNGIHVSPTALWDGLVQNQISSSWEKEEWDDFLSKNVHV